MCVLLLIFWCCIQVKEYEALCRLFLKIFMVLAPLFRSLKCVWVTCLYLMWDRGPNFIVGPVKIQLSQHHLLKDCSFPVGWTWHSCQNSTGNRWWAYIRTLDSILLVHTILIIIANSKFLNQEVWVLGLILFPDWLQFYINLEIRVSFYAKVLLEFWWRLHCICRPLWVVLIP